VTLGVSVEEIVRTSTNALLQFKSEWARVPLSAIARVQNGFPFKSASFNALGKGKPLIRIRDVGKKGTHTFYQGDYDNEFVVHRGDLLIGMDGDFRVARWGGADALLNQRVCRVVVTASDYNERFLELVLQGFLNAIHAETSSVTVKHLSSRSVNEIPLPKPPIEEQESIVAKIDELFSDIDAGQQSVEDVVAALPAAHASLLDAAFSGLLTHEVPDPAAGIPVGWRWATVGDKTLSDVEAGLTKNDAKRKDLPLLLPYLRVANVQENELVLDEIKEIAVTEVEARQKSLEKGDLLVVEGNGSRDQIGRVAVWDGSIPSVVHQNHIIRVRFNETVNPRFALYWLMSARGRTAVVERASTTSGLYTLSKSKVKSLPLPVADRRTQDRIVDLIDEEVSRLAALATYATAAARGAVSLRQSILAAAFSGQLV
jgi:type I restriction enzyme S subunit